MATILPETKAAAEEAQICDPASRHRTPKWSYRIAKRMLDVVVSFFALIILLLPMAVIALLIVMETRGPAIYVHKRIGKNGKPLHLLKFRSMIENAEAMIEEFTPEEMAEYKANFKLENDPRITWIGKFLRKSSLDELPQLINILKGDLSLVGPRPVVMKELEKYGEQKEKFLSVIPGLTGYWQAYARSNCDYETRMEMELYYVDHASFWWDIKIIFATIGSVLRGDGAQ